MMKFTIAVVGVIGLAEASRFKSGAVTGYEKFTYGKFAARMKAPNKKGTVSSFFTYWNGPDFYPGGWNELDVEIVPSVEKNPFSMNIIYGDGKQKHETHDYKRDFDPKDEWHIYEMAWTPDYVSWSIDNNEVRRVKSDDPSIKNLNKGQSVMMNFWTPTFESWGKGFDAAEMPWYVLYDYVETFTYNSKTNGFDFHWRDDFNTFDSNRWHKSDNTTFDANSTTFRASQSYVRDGHLVLKMEPEATQLHPGQHHTPTQVVPVRTEPTYDHTAAKGKKAQKGDEHYDVMAEQHYSHVEHAHQAEQDYRYNPHYDPYAAYYQHHEQQYSPYAHEYESEYMIGGAEAAGAHIDPYHTPEMYSPHHEVSETDAQPIHSAKTHEHAMDHHSPQEVHHSSTPQYYDQMFGGAAHMDGMEGYYEQPEHDQAYLHRRTAEAHHPDVAVHQNMFVHGAPDLERLDMTPFEHAHSDFGSRFTEHGVVPHHEVDHDVHGIQSHTAVEMMDQMDHEVPSYEQLLWAYQHGSFNHDDEVVHHEDDDVHDEDHFGHELPLFDPHRATHEWIMDHGDDHIAPHHYADHDEQTLLERGDHHYDGEYAREHHTGSPYWRGDGHEDQHLQGEDYRHDSDEHHYHAGDVYGHDADYHGGKAIMHDIEHSYDQLFHEIESETKHGVEHHDVEFKTLPLHRKTHDVTHPYSTIDFKDTHHDDHHHEQHYHYDDQHYEGEQHDAHHEVPHQDDHHMDHDDHHDEHYDHHDDHYAAHQEGPHMYAWSAHPEMAHEVEHEVSFHDRVLAAHAQDHYDVSIHDSDFYHHPYDAPMIHGDHDSGEYHELDHEPLHGDVAHGDLHFEPISKDHEAKHTVAYPHAHQQVPHQASHHETPHQIVPPPEASKMAAAPVKKAPASTAAAPQPAVAKMLYSNSYLQ